MELFRALGVLAEPPGERHAELADVLGLAEAPSAEAYTECFLFQLYPYASVYLGREGMLGGDARARIGGFWSALGYTPPTEPDHVSALFGLYAALAEREQAEQDRAVRLVLRNSRIALLWEHIASWMLPYLARLEALRVPPYDEWATIAREAVLGELRPESLPTALPRHLRDAATPDSDSSDGTADDEVIGLLAPVRSGIILVRADVARAARELDLGLRIGERAFVLRTLFSQAPEQTARWLEQEAELWVARHDATRGELGAVAEFWAGRARATASKMQTGEFSHAGY